MLVDDEVAFGIVEMGNLIHRFVNQSRHGVLILLTSEGQRQTLQRRLPVKIL